MNLTRRFKKTKPSREISRRAAMAMFAAMALAVGQTHMARAFIFAGGIASSAPPPSGLAVPLMLVNMDATNSFNQPYVTVGFAFGPGDIPIGGSPTLKDSTGTLIPVQMDQTPNAHSDNSINFGVLSFQMTETIAAGASLNYTVGSSSSAPNNTPDSSWNASGSPEATLMASQDHKVQITNFDTGAVYTTSVNNILTNFTGGTDPNWGTASPQGGWHRYQSGPNMCGWHCWQYIKNDSTGLYQGYVRLDIYIRAPRPTGPYKIECTTLYCNTSDAITTSSEQYRQTPNRFAYTAMVYNGVTPVAYIGGPNDPRATTIPNASFNTTTNVVGGTWVNINYDWIGQAVAFSSTGALPSGLAANTTYFPSWRNSGNTSMGICTQRGYAQHYGTSNPDANWATNTAYNTNQWATNLNQMMVCTAGGTSAASGTGPSGNSSSITDGGATWATGQVDFIDQGSGTISMYPIMIAYQGSCLHHCGNNMEEFWSGTGVLPQIVGQQDRSHLFNISRATMAYGTDITGTPAVPFTVPQWNPMLPPAGAWFLNQTGDNAGDNRIGPINEDAVNAFMNPTSKYYYYSSMRSGLAWSSSWTNLLDERTGHPYIANNGPARNGTAYPNTASPQPNFNGAVKGYGTPNWIQFPTTIQNIMSNFDAFSNNQGNTAETSHMPRLWYGPYLKTGRRPLLDIGMRQAAWVSALFSGRKVTVNSVQLYNVINMVPFNAQLRGAAWGLMMPFMTHWVTPSNEPWQPYIQDVCTDNATYKRSLYDPTTGTCQAAQRTFGIPTAQNHLNPGTMAPWMLYFEHIACGQIGWQGRFTDMVVVCNFYKAFFNLFQGNNIYGISQYDYFYGSRNAENNLSNFQYCYQDADQMLKTSGIASLSNTVTIGATATATISGTTLTLSGTTAGTVTPNATASLADTITGTGIAANTQILAQTGGTPGGDGTYTVSVSQTVGPVSATIKSGTVYITAVSGTGFVCDWQSLSGLSFPANTYTWNGGTSTGGIGTKILTDNTGTPLTQANYRNGAGTLTSAMSNSALPTWQPTQPWLSDGFGNNLANNFPSNCNFYGNAARAALKMLYLATGDSTLNTMLNTLTALIKTRTGLTAAGGVAWNGVYQSNNQWHTTFAVY